MAVFCCSRRTAAERFVLADRAEESPLTRSGGLRLGRDVALVHLKEPITSIKPLPIIAAVTLAAAACTSGGSDVGHGAGPPPSSASISTCEVGSGNAEV